LREFGIYTKLPPMADAADRRTQLLHTALGLLRSKGFGALTQTAVAEAAGVRQGLLTYYFPKRTDLLRAIAEHAAGQAIPPPAPGDAAATTPVIPLGAIRQRLVEETKDEGMPRLMLSLILMADEDPALGQWVAGFQTGLLDRLDQLLRASGHPVPRDRLERLHATVIGLRIRRLMRLPGDTDAHLQALVDRAFGEAVFSRFDESHPSSDARARK